MSHKNAVSGGGTREMFKDIRKSANFCVGIPFDV
jgi:hypothetical protein